MLTKVTWTSKLVLSTHSLTSLTNKRKARNTHTHTYDGSSKLGVDVKMLPRNVARRPDEIKTPFGDISSLSGFSGSDFKELTSNKNANEFAWPPNPTWGKYLQTPSRRTSQWLPNLSFPVTLWSKTSTLIKINKRAPEWVTNGWLLCPFRVDRTSRRARMVAAGSRRWTPRRRLPCPHPSPGHRSSIARCRRCYWRKQKQS